MPPAWTAHGRLPEWPKGAVCKTVGSAYVGSNPTPATTCENAPLAANSRAGGAFLLCPEVCHLVALRTVILRCPRTYSGRASGPLGRSVCTVTTVGVHRRRFHGRPRTGCASGTFRLDRAVQPGSWAFRRSLWSEMSVMPAPCEVGAAIRGRARRPARRPPRPRRSGRGLAGTGRGAFPGGNVRRPALQPAGRRPAQARP
jgi:hypothetical protein